MTHLLLAAALVLSPSQRADIDAIVERVMRERHVAGLSLGIARHRRRLYLRGYGRRDIARRLVPDGYTIYRAGSLAKQFTAALVLQEIAAGRLGLETSVAEYLPASAGGLPPITIAQLLNQTSGFGSQSDGAPAALAFDPGTQWRYSNANYALLGMVLQNVSGTSYPSLLQRQITLPLALRSTGCEVWPSARNVAQGYDWRGGWVEIPALEDEPFERSCGAVGLVANVADLLDWLEGLRAGKVVSPAAFALMTTSGRLRNGIATHYGFGFFLSDWFGYTVAEHSGYVGGFSSQDALVLEDGLEIAVLTNADKVDLTPLTESILAIVDKPRDQNLLAQPSRGPQNENPRITAALKMLVQSARYASFGALASVEFIERSWRGGMTYDKYRLTFSTGQWWATAGYRADETIEALSLMPAQ